MGSITTVAALIERAKVRHWSFNGEGQMPDGAAMQFLSDRQRTALMMIIPQNEQGIGTSEEVATGLLNGVLVAFDVNGNAVFTTTQQDGYAIIFDGNGNAIIDTSRKFVIDPWGGSGGGPGFPLPADILRLISITAVSTQTPPLSAYEVTILEQRISNAHPGGLSLRAFISANRIVPIRDSDTDTWSTVTSLRLEYVVSPTLTKLTDLLTLPEAIIENMVAALAEFLAVSSRTCPTSEKQLFIGARKESDARLIESAQNTYEAVTTSGVVYRG